MNNYYLLIYLTRELNKKLAGSQLVNIITPYKDSIELLFNDESDGFRILCSTHPKMSGLFIDHYRPLKRNNTISFFESLYGMQVTTASLTQHDRFINILFEDNAQLIFKMFGHKANVLQALEGVIIDAFKYAEVEKGEEIPNGKEVTFFEIKDADSDTKNKLIQLNPLLPREFLDILIETHGLDKMDDDQLIDFVKIITNKMLDEPVFRVLASEEITLWDVNILPVETDRVFDSANEAIRYLFKLKSRENRLEDELSLIEKDLSRMIKRGRNTLKNLNKAGEGLERADLYEKYGHLLMANSFLQIEEEVLELQDFYDENKSIKIPVKKEQTVVENAERYYDKARSSRASYEESINKIPAIENEVENLESLKAEIEAISNLKELDVWMKQNKAFIQKQQIGTGKQDAGEPYKKVEAGDYELWIGKNAKSNDKIVQLSHKEDIWLHARGVGGSHVVIRMQSNKDLPPKDIIDQAASYAAYYSQAKGSELVPVIYTKRKYIRKPKGGAPGLVKVDKEEVTIVEPQKP